MDNEKRKEKSQEEYNDTWDNWLKYNLMYLSKHPETKAEDVWSPQQSCVECFFKGSFGNSVKHQDVKHLKFKDFVDEYVKRNPDFMQPPMEFEDEDLFAGFED